MLLNFILLEFYHFNLFFLAINPPSYPKTSIKRQKDFSEHIELLQSHTLTYRLFTLVTYTLCFITVNNVLFKNSKLIFLNHKLNRNFCRHVIILSNY